MCLSFAFMTAALELTWTKPPDHVLQNEPKEHLVLQWKEEHLIVCKQEFTCDLFCEFRVIQIHFEVCSDCKVNSKFGVIQICFGACKVVVIQIWVGALHSHKCFLNSIGSYSNSFWCCRYSKSNKRLEWFRFVLHLADSDSNLIQSWSDSNSIYSFYWFDLDSKLALI